MSQPFWDNEYEALCCAMSHLDAVEELLEFLENSDGWADDMKALSRIRERINAQRLDCLGNGRERPFHVDDLKLQK